MSSDASPHGLPDDAFTQRQTIHFLPGFGETTLNFHGEPEAEVTSEQQEVLRWFLSDLEAHRNQVLNAIFDYYQQEAPAYREAYDPDFVDIDVPEISQPDQISALISEPQIQVPEQNRGRVLYVVFECTWDMEHGVGVCFENGEITEVAGADIAF